MGIETYRLLTLKLSGKRVTRKNARASRIINGSRGRFSAP
jgi:hypothetical protein